MMKVSTHVLLLALIIAIIDITSASCDTSSQPASGPSADAKPPHDSKSAEILQSFCQRTSRAQSFWVNISCKNEDKPAEKKSPSTDGEYVFALRKPDRVALLHKSGKVGFTLICDGFDVELLDTLKRRGIGFNYPKELSKILNFVTEEKSQYLSEFIVISAFFSPDPYEYLHKTYRIGPYLGVEVIDEMSCHHFKMTNKEFDADCWITAAEPPSLRRILATRLVSRRFYRSGNQPATHELMSRDFGTWTFDVDLPIEVFNVQSPHDAKRFVLPTGVNVTTQASE